jgi:hypothetical protein
MARQRVRWLEDSHMPEDQMNLEHYDAHLHWCAVWWFDGTSDELEKMNTYPGAKNEGSRCPKL